MSDKTGIQWTDATWNPTRGCSRVSAGCDHCYAIREAARHNRPGGAYEGLTKKRTRLDWSGVVRLVPEQLDKPLRWRKPRRIFVNSMSDLFHEALPIESLHAVFGIMALAQRHTFQVLTKRPGRMLDVLSHSDLEMAAYAIAALDRRWPNRIVPANVKYACLNDVPWPLPNVWLGVSVENKDHVSRIADLLQTPAAVRFVSYEPALGPVDFKRWLPIPTVGGVGMDRWITWLIVGGETGPCARPCDLAWIRSAVRQCREAGVPCFVKQLGFLPYDHNDAGLTVALRPGAYRYERQLTPITKRPVFENMPGLGVFRAIKDYKGGEMSEWPEDLRVREFPG